MSSYLAAAGGAITGSLAFAGESQAAIVGNSTLQPFGINEEVNIDFNGDGQVDFQIDHDRVPAGGNDYDFLQIDKNDINGAAAPLPFDSLPGGIAATFPAGATTPNNANNAGYAVGPIATGANSDYPAAFAAGAPIGSDLKFTYQEGDNFSGLGTWIRANRLIDEDATQIDQIVGGRTAAGVQVPTNGPNFLGLNGEVRYLGVEMDLNGAGVKNYGWIGIRIDNEADATGAVVGYAYETTPGAPIGAGFVPEPGTALLAAGAVAALVGVRLRRMRRRR